MFSEGDQFPLTWTLALHDISRKQIPFHLLLRIINFTDGFCPSRKRAAASDRRQATLFHFMGVLRRCRQLTDVAGREPPIIWALFVAAVSYRLSLQSARI